MWNLVEEYSKDDLVISLIHHLTHLPNEVLNERAFGGRKHTLPQIFALLKDRLVFINTTLVLFHCNKVTSLITNFL